MSGKKPQPPRQYASVVTGGRGRATKQQQTPPVNLAQAWQAPGQQPGNPANPNQNQAWPALGQQPGNPANPNQNQAWPALGQQPGNPANPKQNQAWLAPGQQPGNPVYPNPRQNPPTLGPKTQPVSTAAAAPGPSTSIFRGLQPKQQPANAPAAAPGSSSPVFRGRGLQPNQPPLNTPAAAPGPSSPAVFRGLRGRGLQPKQQPVIPAAAPAPGYQAPVADENIEKWDEDEEVDILSPYDPSAVAQIRAALEGPAQSSDSEDALLGPRNPSRPELRTQVPEEIIKADQGWERLAFRGGISIIGTDRKIVDRDTLQWWAAYSAAGFDAIIPELPLNNYIGKGFPIDTNYFLLRENKNCPNIYSYRVNWNPRGVSEFQTLPQWKMKIFKEINKKVKASWQANRQYPNYKLGLGIWDRGQTIHRPEAIPDDCLADLNRVTIQSYAPRRGNMRSGPQWPKHPEVVDMMLRYQSLQGVPVPDLKIHSWNDVESYLKNGGDVELWQPLVFTLNNIIQGYTLDDPTSIEDEGTKRMFFRGGYPKKGDRGDWAVINSRVPEHDLFVIRRGSHLACRILPGGIYVNIYTSLASFWKNNVSLVSVVETLFRVASNVPWDKGSFLDPHQLRFLDKNLKYLRVKTSLKNIKNGKLDRDAPNRWYKIWGFSTVPFRDLKVQRYYWTSATWLRTPSHARPKERGGQIKFLDLCNNLYGHGCLKTMTAEEMLYPAVKVDNVWDFYLPLCTLTVKADDKFMHHTQLGKISRSQRQDVLTEDTPKERLGDMQAILRERQTSDPYLAMFNLDVDTKFLQVKGYSLRLPKILVFTAGYNRLLSPSIYPGSWSFKSGQQSTVELPSVDRYMVLHSEPVTEIQCAEWISDFVHYAQTGRHQLAGYQAFHDPPAVIKQCPNSRPENAIAFMDNVRESLQDFLDQEGVVPDIIFWFTDGFPFNCPYDMFKFEFDVRHGIPTQCISMFNFRKRSPQRYFNVLLQLNRKLGAYNLEVREPFIGVENSSGTMIMGADVTHPAGKLYHSITGVVGTNDIPPRTYGARARIQGYQEENIYHLDEMVADLVRKFCERNADPLERLIFFRDGVGDREYGEVLSDEVPKIFNGLDRGTGGGGHQVKLLLILCTKRHHSRFKKAVDNTDLDPGTVINDMNMPHQKNSFFLASHEVTKFKSNNNTWEAMGMSRSTQYHVLVDQIGFSLNDVQQMIYSMSYTYERSQKSISIAPAVHYPHLVCSRAKLYLLRLLAEDPHLHTSLPKNRPYGNNVFAALDAHINLRDTMYYL